MLQRILAAVVGLLIVVPVIVFGGLVGANIIAGLVLLVALDEYSRMAVPEDHAFALVLLVLTGGAVYATHLFLPVALPWVVALGTVVLLIACMVRIRDTALGQRAAARLGIGLLYVPLLLSFVIQVRRLDQGLAWLFLTLTVTWASDSGAYFAGRALGRHKLFPRVSPKKTWEGAIGGFIVAVLFACLFQYLWLPQLGWIHAILVGAALDIVGVLGDLVESMFKRSFGVKDSGWIMPGHGGILDRIDSLLFTAPVAWILASQVLPLV